MLRSPTFFLVELIHLFTLFTRSKLSYQSICLLYRRYNAHMQINLPDCYLYSFFLLFFSQTTSVWCSWLFFLFKQLISNHLVTSTELQFSFSFTHAYTRTHIHFCRAFLSYYLRFQLRIHRKDSGFGFCG